MAKLSDHEYSIISFKAYREDKGKSSIMKAVLYFLLYEVLYGYDAKEFVFTLTNKNLYIDYIDKQELNDIFFTEKTDRRNIKFFDVKKDGAREIITLAKIKGKPEIYIRDNENASNIAAEMAKLIAENA